MTLLNHAELELRLAGLFDKDSDYGGMLGPAIMEMVELFAKQGHSGFSAGMVSNALQKLLRFEPLTPLTGEDDEWTEVGHDTWQNKRCPRIFKTSERGAYDLDGKVFREPSGACFTNSDSRTPVTFPYVPTTVYVDSPEKCEP